VADNEAYNSVLDQARNLNQNLWTLQQPYQPGAGFGANMLRALMFGAQGLGAGPRMSPFIMSRNIAGRTPDTIPTISGGAPNAPFGSADIANFNLGVNRPNSFSVIPGQRSALNDNTLGTVRVQPKGPPQDVTPAYLDDIIRQLMAHYEVKPIDMVGQHNPHSNPIGDITLPGSGIANRVPGSLTRSEAGAMGVDSTNFARIDSGIKGRLPANPPLDPNFTQSTTYQTLNPWHQQINLMRLQGKTPAEIATAVGGWRPGRSSSYATPTNVNNYIRNMFNRE